MLDDGAVLNSPLDLQLVLLRFSDASDRMDTNLSKAAEEGMEASGLLLTRFPSSTLLPFFVLGFPYKNQIVGKGVPLLLRGYWGT